MVLCCWIFDRRFDTAYVNKVLKFVMKRLLDDEYVSRN